MGLNRRFGALVPERVKPRPAKLQVTFSLTPSLNVGKSAFRGKLSGYPPTISPCDLRNGSQPAPNGTLRATGAVRGE